MKTNFRFTLCILIIALLAACQPNPNISNEAIAGIYVVNLTKEQAMAAGVDIGTATVYERTYQLEFTKDGVARLSEEVDIIGMRLLAEEPFTLSADEIFFDADTGIFTCTGVGIEQGTYQWKLEGDQLTLIAKEDECEHRGIVYSAQPWTKQP